MVAALSFWVRWRPLSRGVARGPWCFHRGEHSYVPDSSSSPARPVPLGKDRSASSSAARFRIGRDLPDRAIDALDLLAGRRPARVSRRQGPLVDRLRRKRRAGGSLRSVEHVSRNARLARTGRAGLVTPEQPETRAVPAKNGLRRDEEQRAAPPGKKPREQDKQTALVAAKDGAFDGARRDDELLAQKRVLGDQLGARTGQIGDEASRDARGPACIAKRPHHSFRKLDSGCGKLAEDAEHRAIRPKPKAIIKGLFCRRSRAIVWWRREVASTGHERAVPTGTRHLA